MHVHVRRLGGAVVLAAFGCLVVSRNTLDWMMAPALLGMALVFYRAWPGMVVKFPFMDQWTVTRGGIVSAVVLSIGLPFASLRLRDDLITAETLAPRVVSLFLGTFGLALLASMFNSKRQAAR